MPGAGIVAHEIAGKQQDGTPRTFTDIQEYVKVLNGNRIIEKILIANNGISAVKAIRSMRQWAYEMFGDHNKLYFIVMATPEDVRAKAEYLRMADQIVDVPGGSNNNNYANVMLIVEVAERWAVDAVWAGWGHASENPLLPESLLQTKRSIAFIGPPVKPMKALGDKIGSTIIAQSANVPTIAWNGDGIAVDYKAHGCIPKSIYDQANVTTSEDALACCRRIGFPVMIKASEGGGGKGIRKVTKEEEVDSAFLAVQAEIPGSPIFVMQLAPDCRHLEVQLLADEYGSAIALSGRDCSVQRRHQKIIEEGPVVSPPNDVWKQMEKAATDLAKEVSYRNAGTVEYLYSPKTEQFFFLELNPRLQVEHPVTEMITGVNLPAAQLQIAMGIPVDRIPDVRKLYGFAPFSDDHIDVESVNQCPPNGHVIACRITAENPDAGFTPTSGNIEEINFRCIPDVWGYFSVDSSGRVHEFADSQIGHLFSWGLTRERSRKNMVVALKELSIRGDIRTTIEYLEKLLEDADFMDNRITTSWLDTRIAKEKAILSSASSIRPSSEMESLLIVMVTAACEAFSSFSDRAAEYAMKLERGQLPPINLLKQTEPLELIFEHVKYVLEVSQSGPRSFTLECNSVFVDADVRLLSDGGFLVFIFGESHVAYVSKEALKGGLRVILDGKTCEFTAEYDPTRLLSSAAGKLIRRVVPEGAKIQKGGVYAEVEVMKMYMPLLAPEDGEISWTKREGAVLAPGELIATMTLEDPTCVKTSKRFEGSLLDGRSERTGHLEKKALYALRDAVSVIERVLDGFRVRSELWEDALVEMKAALEDKDLPKQEVIEAVSALQGRVTNSVLDPIKAAADQSDVDAIRLAIEKHREFLGTSTSFEAVIQPLIDILEMYQGSSRRVKTIESLLSRFLDVEALFVKEGGEDSVLRLRRQFPGDMQRVHAISRAHFALAERRGVLLMLLKSLRGEECAPLFPVLEKIAKLHEKRYSLLALEARHLLSTTSAPSFEQRRTALLEKLVEIRERGDITLTVDDLEVELVMALIGDEGIDRSFRLLAMEMYARKIYSSYIVEEMVAQTWDGVGFLSLLFKFCSSEAGDAVKLTTSESYDDLSSLLLKKRSSFGSKGGNSGSGSGSDGNSGSSRSLEPGAIRQGIMVCFKTLDALAANFDKVLDPIPWPARSPSRHVLHCAVYAEARSESAAITFIQNLLSSHKASLAGVRRVSVAVRHGSPTAKSTGVYTFRERLQFREDSIVRHMEAPLAYMLELKRLSNYQVVSMQCASRTVHMYLAEPKRSNANISYKRRGGLRKRFFVRAVVRHTEKIDDNSRLQSVYDAHPGPERTFVEALNALEMAMGTVETSGDGGEVANNHLFLSVVPEAVVDPEYIEAVIRILASRYAEMLTRLRVSQVEFRINARFTPDAPLIPVRLVASNPTGFVLRVDSYVEAIDGNSSIFTSISDGHVGDLDGLRVDTPYPVVQSFEERRELAEKMSDTLFIYDFLELFENALGRIWKQYVKERRGVQIKVPRKLVKFEELVLAKKGESIDADITDCPEELLELRTTNRLLGANDVGVVAWVSTLYTPEYPQGRQVILVGNDITHKAGSFGTVEDILFRLASEKAREMKIPRLYVAANSGARIGMADSVKRRFKAGWVDESDVTKGFEYLYLTEEDYEGLKSAVKCERKEIEGGKEVRWVLKDVIGIEGDLGVECLRGSAAIAGETSRANADVFTLTYVAGRTVGIGAYLVRLGQRTIQRSQNSPIILTGYQALNKLMGKDVYTSNDQLGGVGIMHTNGVTHMTVDSHLDGVIAMLNWLSFVPEYRGAPLPVLDITGLDVVERDIAFMPPSGKVPYDPRWLLTGAVDTETGEALNGFFDKGSFVESMANWAKSVIVGRARLGGIPVGVIIPEVRTAEKLTPADPAAPATMENLVQQAGQVWFPDSAHKTATIIKDLKGEDLPLFIFANWRGFSGGQRDMFDEVLKFGAAIVDNLVSFTQPVFVYIPPFAELRGGAWVVVDPRINRQVMEMYAAESARGGVLEPAGLIEIKYRKKELLSTAHRLDQYLRVLDSRALATREAGDVEKAAEIDALIDDREDEILPIYMQMAMQFADLHDTPGRMHAVDAIDGVVEWRKARSFFYWRLRRCLAENALIVRICKAADLAGDSINREEAVFILRSWLNESKASDDGEGKIRFSNLKGGESLWENDRAVLCWMLDEKEFVDQKLYLLKAQRVALQVQKIGKEEPKAAVSGILRLVDSLGAEEREEVVQALRRGSIFVRGGAR